MGHCAANRNFMDEMRDLICEIERLKPEPEVCNVRCPPLGCPRGPCPGMNCYEGVCDPCSISEMPCCPPAPHPPPCCAPACLSSLKRASHRSGTTPRTCTGNSTSSGASCPRCCPSAPVNCCPSRPC